MHLYKEEDSTKVVAAKILQLFMFRFRLRSRGMSCLVEEVINKVPGLGMFEL